ncbi:MAG: hypothetical protein WA705_13845 [Candidatus Ozemobacteraceae bacterium]
MIHVSRPIAIGLLLGTIAATFLWVAAKAPISQNLLYHNFADQRSFVGIPNTLDTVSNIVFFLAGGAGILLLTRRKPRTISSSSPSPEFVPASAPISGPTPVIRPEELPVYLTFFVGVFLVGLGSTWYHLWPSNTSLVWDRFSMTIAFLPIGLMPIVERINARIANIMLLPILLLGLGSVWYWHITESAGAGDLRPYLFVRVIPLFLLLVATLTFPPRYTHGYEPFIGIGFFALATIAEKMDREIFTWLGFMSGHTLKHLLAGFGAYRIVLMLTRRKPVSNHHA